MSNKRIGLARFRPGLLGAMTARIWISGAVCVFQYWLITASMEAFNAGHPEVVFPATVAALLSFGLNVALLISGERHLPKVESN